jgi:hypothetical protein
MPRIIHLLQPPCTKMHLKWVVLGSDFHVEVAAEYRHLLHNVLAHLWYLGEEEEGEETGYATETGSESTAGRELVGDVIRREERMGHTPSWLFGR